MESINTYLYFMCNHWTLELCCEIFRDTIVDAKWLFNYTWLKECQARPDLFWLHLDEKNRELIYNYAYKRMNRNK